MPFFSIYHQQRCKMETEKEVTVFLSEFEFQVSDQKDHVQERNGLG